jgi:hypothetical protein
MDTTEINIWEHYGKTPEPNMTLIERLRNTGPKEGPNGVVTGRFPSWEDAHIAADMIEHLERRVTDYEETIRYLTLQVSKNV